MGGGSVGAWESVGVWECGSVGVYTVNSLCSKPLHALLVDAATLLTIFARPCAQPPLPVQDALHFGMGG